MAERAQKRVIMCGTNGTGKSTLASKIIDASTFNNGRRALALLPDDSEPIFQPYNELSRAELKFINQVSNVKNKIYFDKRTIFGEIENTFKHGILALDDARFYTGSADEELKKLFIRSRQNNVDILFICHGLSEIPPSLITYATEIILFNTVDSWERLKKKIPNPEYFEQIVNEVRTKANNHKFTLKIIDGEKQAGGAPFMDVQTKQMTNGKPFSYKNRDGVTVSGVGCNAFSRERCNCGTAYVKKVIDVKRDLISTNGL